ncbi:hypothetical protein PV08_05632 [Exophiala spinifera]|uniref:Acyl-CoA dehydrogenase/oxidase C-terminal domain-containing protein n=1 Tax=Exophiala spinifera TaxID=91928 RepID=A0A0D2BWF2_9EURO|nr:uncharacterized protein PV08_05632 [Exophiala spinifera]KIW15584.1 hypothetical protein PV08_05632 [Exophiala spinifera]
MGQMKPSSSTSGFFQDFPVVLPQYTSTTSSESASTSDDPTLPRILSLYLPTPTPREVSKHLHDFSRLVLSPSTLSHTVDCETDQPTLHPLTTFGEENKTSPLRTSEGWRALKQIQTKAGVVGHGYAHASIHAPFNRRINQFATLQLWDGSAALATCPIAMTDGAAVLLRRHLHDEPDDSQPFRADVFLESYRRLISLDPSYAWTSGQWMTERTGGSDVSGTETVARRMTPQELESDAAASRDQDAHGLPLGPWTVSGYKWFSSATDADMTILLAQTDKGLSAFYAPLRRRVGRGQAHHHTDTEMNGVRPIRLKSKLGTKGLPTAELEVANMRAYLIGQEGQGVREISSILNITRLHTARGGAGYLGRGLAVSRAYTRVRRVRGGLLSDNPQHLAWMADETVKYAAGSHLVFLGVALLGSSEQGHDAVTRGTPAGALLPRDKESADTLLRIITPVMKSQVTMNSVSGLRACMECLGGVGYCENNEDGGVLNVARLFRDSVVGTIWEGTTSVMAEDVLRVIKNPKDKERRRRRDVLDAVFGAWTRAVLAAVEQVFALQCRAVLNRYDALKEMVDRLSVGELLRRGRDVLDHIEAVACSCLLMFDACRDGDEVANAIAKTWVRSKALPADAAALEEPADWMKAVDLDRKIFLGSDAGTRARAQARL